jgi:hypothetical protein
MKAFLACALVAMAACLGACSHIQYQTADGRKVEIWRFGMDTKIGKLDASAPDGTKISIENLDAQSRAVELAQQVLQKVPAIPVP